MTDPVVLDELARTGEVRRLDNDHAAALVGTGLVEARPAGAGRWLLLPTGKVGAVRVGDLDVQVRPKVDVARLLFLLGYAADPGFRPEDAAAHAEPQLWPALAESLARYAGQALGPGVLQGYVTVDDSLPLVRGRIRVADQLAARPDRLLPLEVRYDEYTVDIAENRLLRSALRAMTGVPGLATATRARLSHFDRSRLDGVALLPQRAVPPAWQPTRLNARYHPALRLAELVLRHHSSEIGPGGLPVASFVVSMAKVFEDFVTTALHEALSRYPGHTKPQHQVYLDEQHTIEMRPDVVHLVHGHPVAVFDAKYKLATATGGFPSADAYQLLAYCTALRLPVGWLVYAQGAAPSQPRRVRHTPVEIRPYPLDLSASPAVLLRHVTDLVGEAAAVAGMVGAAGAPPPAAR